MPVVPNLVERFYMFRLNRGPGPMLDLFGGMALEAALTAQELGVFQALDEQPSTPAELADRLDASEQGLDVLLGFLAEADYVITHDGRYRPTSMSETWFLESSPQSYSRYFRFWRDVLYPFWREQAESALRAGAPPQTVYDWLDDHPDLWPVAQAAFELTAELIGDDIARAVELPADGRLLDVGGGHALYSIAFCEQYPELNATVFDDPAIAEIARKHIASATLEDRIRFQSGDYETDALGDGYDGALVFNVVHGNDPATNQQLFRKVAEATTSDGTIAILDQFDETSRSSIGETGTRFLDLTYLVSLGGRTYPISTVRDWLEEAGFGITEKEAFQDRNMTLLIANQIP